MENKITEAELAGLQEKNKGEVVVFESEFGEAAFRPAEEKEWQRFIDELSDPDLKGRALRMLVIACCVWPERPRFEALVARRPGLIQSFGNELTELSGLKKAVVRKK